MALWGNNDAKGSGGTVSLDYATLVVTGSGTTFGQVGAAATGDVIRFGSRTGTFHGDAVIVGIASTTQLSIASTTGLSGAAISGVQFDISELPKYTVFDVKYSQANWGTDESSIYGVSGDGALASGETSYALTHAGWVGVTTYMDSSVNPPVLRVKTETLVAMSGITTGNTPAYPPV